MSQICLDCELSRSKPEEAIPENPPEDFYCIHWRPDYWEKRGYVRNWGDAAVMNWPDLEVLRKETDEKVEYVILAPRSLRRPATYFFDKKSGQSWGGY